MESKVAREKGPALPGEFGQSDVHELRPNERDASARDEISAPLSRRTRLKEDERPPESVEGDLLEPDDEEETPSFGSPRDSASSLSHKPPPKPHAQVHSQAPHPPERSSSLAPPRASHPPGSEPEMRISPPVINMGFDGLQMLLETRLRDVNAELAKVAQASSRGQLVRGALIIIAFAFAGGVIGYLSGSSVEARTRANIREEVMKTYYGPEVSPEKRKEILGFVQGQLAKSDLGLRLWVDGELRNVDQVLAGMDSENQELKALRAELNGKENELHAMRTALEQASSKRKADKANKLARLAPVAPSPDSEPTAAADASAAPAMAPLPSAAEEANEE